MDTLWPMGFALEKGPWNHHPIFHSLITNIISPTNISHMLHGIFIYHYLPTFGGFLLPYMDSMGHSGWKKKHAPQDVFLVDIPNEKNKQRQKEHQQANCSDQCININIHLQLYQLHHRKPGPTHNCFNVWGCLRSFPHFLSPFRGFHQETAPPSWRLASYRRIHKIDGWGGKAWLSMLMMYIPKNPWTLQWKRGQDS